MIPASHFLNKKLSGSTKLWVGRQSNLDTQLFHFPQKQKRVLNHEIASQSHVLFFGDQRMNTLIAYQSVKASDKFLLDR
jgi:hypothetical protein